MIPRANHPWKFIQRELKSRGRTQKQFAELLGKTTAEVNDIITWKRNITIDRAMRIWAAFWTSHEVWLGMQNKFDAVQIMKQEEKQQIFENIRKKVGNFSTNQEYAFA